MEGNVSLVSSHVYIAHSYTICDIFSGDKSCRTSPNDTPSTKSMNMYGHPASLSSSLLHPCISGTGIQVRSRTSRVVTTKEFIIRSSNCGFGWENIRPGRGIRTIHFWPVEGKWRGMTMLKVPKVGTQVKGGEMQGMLLLRREAMRQSPSREMPERKSSTAITDSDEELEVIDLGVRPVPVNITQTRAITLHFVCNLR